MSDGRRSISPEVALKETAALADFYRNRSLILAQENAELREQIATMQRNIVDDEDRK